jgi:hypothetical protein
MDNLLLSHYHAYGHDDDEMGLVGYLIQFNLQQNQNVLFYYLVYLNYCFSLITNLHVNGHDDDYDHVNLLCCDDDVNVNLNALLHDNDDAHDLHDLILCRITVPMTRIL